MRRWSVFAVVVVFSTLRAGAGQAPLLQRLWEPTNISDVHLTFAPDQFASLNPRFNVFRHPTDTPGRSWLVGPEGGRNGLSASRGLEFDYVHADVAIGDRIFPNSGVRYKGNGTFSAGRGSGKISFKLDLNRFVKGQKLGRIKTLNLHNNITDASFMNEPLAFRLYRDAGVPAPRTSYARVYVTVTGKDSRRLVGLFSLVENPDDVFLEARGLASAGAVLKPVTQSLFTYLGTSWAAYNQIYDPKTELTDDDKKRVIDAAELVTHADDARFAARIGDFIDLDRAAAYFAVNTYLADMDGILGTGQNYYVYLDPTTRKFSFFAWDQDHSWGQFGPVGAADLDILHPWNRVDNRFLARLFNVPAFRTRYLSAMRRFSSTIFDSARIAAQVDEVSAAIRAAVAEESGAALARLDEAVRDREPPVRTPNSLSHLVQTGGSSRLSIKPFAIARARSIAAQLAKLD